MNTKLNKQTKHRNKIYTLLSAFFKSLRLKKVNDFEKVIKSSKNKRLVKYKNQLGYTIYEIHVKSRIFKNWKYPFKNYNENWFVIKNVAISEYNNLK